MKKTLLSVIVLLAAICLVKCEGNLSLDALLQLDPNTFKDPCADTEEFKKYIGALESWIEALRTPSLLEADLFNLKKVRELIVFAKESIKNVADSFAGGSFIQLSNTAESQVQSKIIHTFYGEQIQKIITSMALLNTNRQSATPEELMDESQHIIDEIDKLCAEIEDILSRSDNFGEYITTLQETLLRLKEIKEECMQEEYAGSIKLIPDSALVVPDKSPEPNSGLLDDGDNADNNIDNKQELQIKEVAFDPNSAKISMVEHKIASLIQKQSFLKSQKKVQKKVALKKNQQEIDQQLSRYSAKLIQSGKKVTKSQSAQISIRKNEQEINQELSRYSAKLIQSEKKVKKSHSAVISRRNQKSQTGLQSQSGELITKEAKVEKKRTHRSGSAQLVVRSDQNKVMQPILQPNPVNGSQNNSNINFNASFDNQSQVNDQARLYSINQQQQPLEGGLKSKSASLVKKQTPDPMQAINQGQQFSEDVPAQNLIKQQDNFGIKLKSASLQSKNPVSQQPQNLIAKSSGIKLRSGSLEKKADNVVEAVPLNDNNNNQNNNMIEKAIKTTTRDPKKRIQRLRKQEQK